jgi:hypothetical protein
MSYRLSVGIAHPTRNALSIIAELIAESAMSTFIHLEKSDDQGN